MNSIINGKFKHISRFSIVGVLNTVIDFVMFTVFHALLGVSSSVSQVVGYSCGVANSFVFNKKWTFAANNSNRKTYMELLKFILVNLLSLTVTVVTINILTKDFRINVYISKVIVTFIAQAINFLCYKLLVFK